ncbi:MAG: hypothetical protein HYY06_12180 [Deltaproteobacteria bacterium]|nr:hypothetical protein [Deltaproteobacteria bacterium]
MTRARVKGWRSVGGHRGIATSGVIAACFARFWQSYAAFRHILRRGYASPCEAWESERQTGSW